MAQIPTCIQCILFEPMHRIVFLPIKNLYWLTTNKEYHFFCQSIKLNAPIILSLITIIPLIKQLTCLLHKCINLLSSHLLFLCLLVSCFHTVLFSHLFVSSPPRMLSSPLFFSCLFMLHNLYFVTSHSSSLLNVSQFLTCVFTQNSYFIFKFLLKIIRDKLLISKQMILLNTIQYTDTIKY